MKTTLVTILIFVLLLSYGKYDPLSAGSPLPTQSPLYTPTPPPNVVVITDFGTRAVTVWHVLLAVVVIFLILILIVRLIDIIRR